MTSLLPDKSLTHALEDYLETIQQFVDEKGFARVRDICEARGVKSGSVSPAMKRLAEMGLTHHRQGEFITLTREGEAIAQRTQARHDLLVRFFKDFLRVDYAQSEEDACAIEHHLSDASMDRLTRLFEFLQNCPEGHEDFLERFHGCPIVNHISKVCDHRWRKDGGRGHGATKRKPLTVLKPGERGLVARIDAKGETRWKLLNLGLLPDTEMEMDRNDAARGVRLLVNHHPITLTANEARKVLLQ